MRPQGACIAISLVLVLSLLAGCVSDEDGVDPVAEDTEETGATIEGTVTTELFEPLDAQVLLFDEDRSAILDDVTAERGLFSFDGLDPGVYVVQARHPGFESEVRGVEVETEGTTSIEFQLLRVPADDGYAVEDEVRGRIHTYAYRAEVPGEGCISESNPAGWLPLMPSTLGNCNSDYIPFIPWERARGTLDEEVMDENTMTVVVEMFWEPAGVLGENLRLVVRCDEGNSTSDPCWHEDEDQTSPNIVRINQEEMAEHGYNMTQTWTWHALPGWGMLGTYETLGVDVGLSYEQTFTILFTYFQNEPAPEDFSRLPDN